jgi:DNA helicase-2/ATP-dependent DNA helicase PcrA
MDNETIKINILKNLYNKYEEIREHPLYSNTFSITECVPRILTQKESGSNYSHSLDVDLVTSILNGLEEIKRKENKIDYTDMIVNFLKLLKLPKYKLIFNDISQKVKHLIVDEYQDVNALQHAIAEQLGGIADSFMIVGDDDQSIYGFRGAKMEFLMNFKNNHPDAQIIALETNFRSSQEILNLANTSISNNTNRIEKKLSAHKIESTGKPCFYHCYNQHHQAFLVTKELMEDKLNNIPLKSHAILVRQKFEVEMLIEMLIHCNVNYNLFLGSETSSLRKDIHNLISFLRVGLNPYEKTPWLRMLPLHKGIDQIYTKQTVDNLFSKQRPPGQDPLEYFIEADFSSFSWSRRSTERDASLNQLKLLLRNMYWDDERKVRKTIVHSSIYNLLLKILDYNENYIDNIYERDTLFDHFFKSAKNFRKQLERFIEYWDPPKNNDSQLRSPSINNEKDAVIITTIHQAKGLEWDKVYILNFLKDFIPHKRAKTPKEIEEERRLFHVAITRAKTHLTVYIPKYRNPWYYEQSKAYPSQFFEDIHKGGDFIEKTIEDNRDWSDTDTIIGQLNVLNKKNTKKSQNHSTSADLDHDETNCHPSDKGLGFCITCHTTIKYDPKLYRVRCQQCYFNSSKEFHYCHQCGKKNHNISLDSPICKKTNKLEENNIKLPKSNPNKAYSVEKIRIEHPNAYKKWFSEEDEALKKIFIKIQSIDELSKLFKRKPGAIRSRLKKLGLLEINKRID